MHPSRTTRRSFLSGIAGATSLFADDAIIPADIKLRIAPLKLEVAPGRFVETVGYNGSVPCPLIRFRENETVTVDIFNETHVPEFVHWHGFDISTDVDGAEEEGSPAVAAHERLRYRLTPVPAGFRYVHTHAMSMANLSRGTFTGQFGFAFVEPKSNPARYDQEVFLATHEWEPSLTHQEEEDDTSPPPRTSEHKGGEAGLHGWEIKYRYATINGKCLGFGDPVRVKEGQRVLFHLLNASATESVRLALPGHRFQVVALDGNPVPHPALVDMVELGAAERVDAIVTMDSPGVFVLGTPKNTSRTKGLGVVVEYANRTGKPLWVKPATNNWDYTTFGDQRVVPKPDEVIPLVIGQGARTTDGFESWTINRKGYDASKPVRLARGRRYRLLFDNQTEDAHPVHLHRSSFELTSVSGTPTAGIIKDVVLVKGHQKVEADFTPSMTGLHLFHCHQQLHMDYGFKMLFDVT